MIEDTCEKAKALRLKTIANQLPEVMQMAAGNNWPPLKTIDHLFELEIEARRLNRIALCFRQSKLTEKLTIDQFDFDHHSSRKKNKTRILNLLSLGFLEETMDIILIGNPVSEKPSWPRPSPMRPPKPERRSFLPPPWT